MKFLCKTLILFLSITTAHGADKDAAAFEVGPVSSYKNRQTINGLTIAAEVFASRDQMRSAFGKTDPTAHGVLPILVVMSNGSDKVLRLENMRMEYIRKDRYRVPSTPAEEVRYLYPTRRPQTVPAPATRRLPIPGLGGNRNDNPLAAIEIESRAFAARMLPPGETASGFFYFHTASHAGSMLYITGIQEAATGQELFFFEIPLD